MNFVNNKSTEYNIWKQKLLNYHIPNKNNILLLKTNSNYKNANNNNIKTAFDEIISELEEEIVELRKKKNYYTEERLLREMNKLIEFLRIIYNAKHINKTPVGPRSTNKYKQIIYDNEVKLIKDSLMEKLDTYRSFEEISNYIAVKRQMIEFLKLAINYDDFGKIRILQKNGKIIHQIISSSPFIGSKANHLLEKLNPKNKQIKYRNIDLTRYKINTNNSKLVGTWVHTHPDNIDKLFKIMNKLYDLLRTTNDKKKIKRIISKLYWLYMQTCPYYRGSASIGEILFSVLLQKYLGCDFKISSGWNRNPETIPDIHALSYDLKDFIKIFYSQFTTCEVDNVNNNNNNNNNNN